MWDVSMESLYVGYEKNLEERCTVCVKYDEIF